MLKTMTSNILHASASDSWMTPNEVLIRVRQTLGGIDLDPASSSLANKRVGAQHYYTEQDDALRLHWNGAAMFQEIPNCTSRVFCNPPGGKYPKGHPRAGQSKTGLFWQKLMIEVAAGNITDAIFLFFSIEGMSNCQGYDWKGPPKFPTCIPASRLKFVPENYEPGKKDRPSHANAIVYVPGTVNRTLDFAANFQDLGNIMVPYRP